MPMSRASRRERTRAPKTAPQNFTSTGTFTPPYGKALLGVTGKGSDGSAAYSYQSVKTAGHYASAVDVPGHYETVVDVPGHGASYEVGPWYTTDPDVPGHYVNTYAGTSVSAAVYNPSTGDWFTNDYPPRYDGGCPAPTTAYKFGVDTQYSCSPWYTTTWVPTTYKQTYHSGYTYNYWVDPTYKTVWVSTTYYTYWVPTTYQTVPVAATNGAPAQFGGVTFPGGIGGPASPVYANVPIPNGTYAMPVSVPSGANVSITVNP